MEQNPEDEPASELLKRIGANLNRSEAYRLPIIVPPLAEQRRIVAKVDELMALCDELEVAQAKRERRRDRLVATTLHGLGRDGGLGRDFGLGRDRSPSGPLLSLDPKRPQSNQNGGFGETALPIFFNHLPRLTTRPEHIHQLRQTILNLAVRGKLVPQNPEDEPAPKLLHRIEAEKTRLMEDGTIRKEKPLPPVPEVEFPFLLPVNWRWMRIGTFSLMTDYGTSAKSDHYEDGVPVLKMGDIQEGRVHLGGQKKVPRASEDLPQLFLKHFDLLYNRTNSAELVGKTGIYMGEDDAYTFASYLIRIRFIRHLTSPVYANMAMNAPYFRETQILPELKQQCGQANVKVLTHPLLFRSPEGVRLGNMDDYYWTEIGEAFVLAYPTRNLELADKILEHFGEDNTILEGFSTQTQPVLNAITRANPEEIWKKITKYLGPPIDHHSYHIEAWLRGDDFSEEKDGMLQHIPKEKVWEWVDEAIEKRAWYLASFVPKNLFREDGKICWAREVLIRYGDREDVRRNLTANFSTEGWSGPLSLHYQNKKQWLLDFKKDETNQNVKLWIDEYVAELEEDINRGKIDEERRGY